MSEAVSGEGSEATSADKFVGRCFLTLLERPRFCVRVVSRQGVEVFMGRNVAHLAKRSTCRVSGSKIAQDFLLDSCL